jgi:hypothetical protein
LGHRVQPSTLSETLLDGLGDIIDGEYDIESDSQQDRDNDDGVGDHYAFPLFLVELGVLRLQAGRQQTEDDDVDY